MNPQPLPDSGARTSFQTGAVRDAMSGKGFPSDIPPVAIRAMAKRFEDGAGKYDRGNWQKGIPLSRFYDAIIRHLMAWGENRDDEDHGGAVLWNMACAMWTEEEVKAGRLPKELDDLPYRKKVVRVIDASQSTTFVEQSVTKALGGEKICFHEWVMAKTSKTQTPWMFCNKCHATTDGPP